MPELAARYADHPMIRWVRSYPDDYYTRMEAAESLDVTLSMLTWFAQRFPEAHLGPSHKARYQGIEIMLYSPERMEEIRAWVENYKATRVRRRGRQRMFTAAELQYRRRMGGRARDYRRRAKAYETDGRMDDAAALREAAVALEAELAKDRATREEELRKPAATAGDATVTD